MRKLTLGLLAFVLSGCGEGDVGLVQQQQPSSEQPPEEDPLTSAANNALAAAAAVSGDADPSFNPARLTTAQRSEACRSAIAKLNGRDKKIVKSVSDDGEIVRVRYTRPDDGSKWTSECRFEDGSRIIWRAVDAFGAGSGAGRWRDGIHDEKISYTVNGKDVEVVVDY